MRSWVRPGPVPHGAPPDFPGTAAALRTPRETGVLFPDSDPLPARRDSGVRRLVAEKRELFPGPQPPSLGSAASPPTVRSQVREGGPRFPFATRSGNPGLRPIDRFAPAGGDLGSTNSRASAVLEKPFSASALRVLAWVVATTTKICTTGRSTPPYGVGVAATCASRLLGGARSSPTGGVRGSRSGAINFRGRSVRRVRFYTLLGGFRLP